MANTSDRQLWLINSNDDTIETYTYSANNSSGISDEKIVMNKNNSSSNWENSFQTTGTPGKRNSVTPLSNDLSVSAIIISPEIPLDGDNVKITAAIKNEGTNIAQNFSIEIYNDVNFDSSGLLQELIFSQNFSNLLPGDSVKTNTTINSVNEGNYQLIGKVNYQGDEDTTNNKEIVQFKVYPPGNNYNDILINEIMYAPSSGEPEWVELYNRTDSQINLKEWTFSDNSTSVSITNTDKFIQNNSFIVLSRDSSILNFYQVPVDIIVFKIPSLNNTGDAVLIKDSLGVLIDSLEYLPNWGGNTGGKSLERISINESSTLQTNWGTSVSKNKATPGSTNSITPKDFDLKISSFEIDKDYGIIGEKINFKVKVTNPGLNPSGNFTVKIFKDVNADSISQSTEEITEVQGSSILSGDSTQLDFQTQDFSEGNNYYIAYLKGGSDQDTTNNIAFAKLKGVTINEVRNDIV